MWYNHHTTYSKYVMDGVGKKVGDIVVCICVFTCTSRFATTHVVVSVRHPITYYS